MSWFTILIQLLPAIEEAINTIVSATPGLTQQQATAQLVDHITPGQPNAPALGPKS